LPLDKTELAKVLKLDKPESERPTPDQLVRYTLRWDISYPDLVDDWMNSTFHTMETFLPIVQVRQAKPRNQRQTYSVTLDQVVWGSWQDTQPMLLFITEGPMK